MIIAILLCLFSCFATMPVELSGLLAPLISNPPSRWRLDKKTKPTGWDIDWTEDDDSLLLIGVYNYGLGSWEQILKDSKIGLGEKVHQHSTDL